MLTRICCASHPACRIACHTALPPHSISENRAGPLVWAVAGRGRRHWQRVHEVHRSRRLDSTLLQTAFPADHIAESPDVRHPLPPILAHEDAILGHTLLLAAALCESTVKESQTRKRDRDTRREACCNARGLLPRETCTTSLSPACFDSWVCLGMVSWRTQRSRPS